MHLYEAHLPVASTAAAVRFYAVRFYAEVVGLRVAHRDPGRDIVFLFDGPGKASMLGLWGPTTTRAETRGCGATSDPRERRGS